MPLSALPVLLRACYARAMPALILPLIEAATRWTERGALVGLDLGTKTIGVAVSDPDRRLATGVASRGGEDEHGPVTSPGRTVNDRPSTATVVR